MTQDSRGASLGVSRRVVLGDRELTVDARETIESFAADPTGSFSSNPAPAAVGRSVPDANSLLLGIFGLTIGGFVCVPRRGRSAGR